MLNILRTHLVVSVCTSNALFCLQEDAKMQVEAFCVIDFKAEHYHPLLEECMSECAFKAVENLCKVMVTNFDRQFYFGLSYN